MATSQPPVRDQHLDLVPPRPEADHLLIVQPVAGQDRQQLLRLDEHGPVVQGNVDDARPLPFLGQLDHNELAQSGVVDGVVLVDTTRFQHAGRLGDDPIEISHVLQHIPAVDTVDVRNPVSPYRDV